MADVWSYEGKRVVIAGCFSGMGEAAARELVRLGAEVHGVDVKQSPVDMASFNLIDLREAAQVDDVLGKIGGTFDASFYCAGLPGTFDSMEVMQVNFINSRYWNEKVVEMMPDGGALAMISSTAGHDWPTQLDNILELLATPDTASATKWCDDHLDVVADGYMFSKMCLQVYTMRMAAELIAKGVRINCINPAPTITPMMADFEEQAPAAFIDAFAKPMGRRSTPEEQAYPLIFLNSDAASYISGHRLNVDGGWAGSVDSGTLSVDELMHEALSQLEA